MSRELHENVEHGIASCKLLVFASRAGCVGFGFDILCLQTCVADSCGLTQHKLWLLSWSKDLLCSLNVPASCDVVVQNDYIESGVVDGHFTHTPTSSKI